MVKRSSFSKLSKASDVLDSAFLPNLLFVFPVARKPALIRSKESLSFALFGQYVFEF